MSIIRGTYV